MTKLEAVTGQLSQAVSRLKEALDQPYSDFIRDASIQRFEFTVDLAWKSLKTYLEEEKGIICHSPKDCVRSAFQNGLIDYDEKWLGIIDMRNQTAHIYKQELAEEIFSKLKPTLPLFESLLDKLQR